MKKKPENEVPPEEWNQLAQESLTTAFSYADPRLDQRTIFLPKTDLDRKLEARFAHLSPA